MGFFAQKEGSGWRLNLGEIGGIPFFSELFDSKTSRDRKRVWKYSVKLFKSYASCSETRSAIRIHAKRGGCSWFRGGYCNSTIIFWCDSGLEDNQKGRRRNLYLPNAVAIVVGEVFSLRHLKESRLCVQSWEIFRLPNSWKYFLRRGNFIALTLDSHVELRWIKTDPNVTIWFFSPNLYWMTPFRNQTPLLYFV